MDNSFLVEGDLATAEHEHRVVMTMADLRFFPFDGIYSGPFCIYIQNLTVAIYKTRYTMGDYDATYVGRTDNKNKTDQAKARPYHFRTVVTPGPPTEGYYEVYKEDGSTTP